MGLDTLLVSRFHKSKSSKDYGKVISNHHKRIDDTYAIFKAVQIQMPSPKLAQYRSRVIKQDGSSILLLFLGHFNGNVR